MEGNPTNGSSAQLRTPLAINAARRATSAPSASAKGVSGGQHSHCKPRRSGCCLSIRTFGSHPSTCLCLHISINEKVVDSKLTQELRSLITPFTYNLIATPKLGKPLKPLRGPKIPIRNDRSQTLPCKRIGTVNNHLIQDLEESFLGLPAIRELNVPSFLQEVTSSHEYIYGAQFE